MSDDRETRSAAESFASAGKIKMALSGRNAHCRQMPKTKVSNGVTKYEKAFLKAMRALNTPKGRRNFSSRPR